MKPTLTFLLICVASWGFSQPTITQSNIPLIGDNVTIAICSDPLNEGSSGVNQTWDFSGLTESEEQSFIYVDPGTTPKADSFPDANLCGISWDGSYSYYKVSPNALEAVGYVTPVPPTDTAMIVFDDFEQIVQFPYTYNDNFLDVFDGTNYVPGFGGLDFDGDIDFEADGYGTLILPTGTYNNVVRYHFFREQTNYVSGFPSNTQTKEQWAWVSADYRFWLLLMEENFDGFATTELIWYDKNPLSLVTGLHTEETSGISVYPNPVADEGNINLTWKQNEDATVSIYSMEGKLVFETNNNLISGVNPIKISSLVPGTYLLKIHSATEVYNQRIILVN